jgi:hypothetical protein
MHEVNGHSIVQEKVDIEPFGKMTRHQCQDEECEITVTGGDDRQIREIAQQNKCPRGADECDLCGSDVLPEADICRSCHSTLTVSDQL